VSRKIEIVPAIIAKTSEELKRMVKIIEPYVDRVHLDIMDGEFVSNKTVSGYEELLSFETKLGWDIHLMVLVPEKYMDNWYKTKADMFLIHVETINTENSSLIQQIHLANRKVGLVLNPETDIDKIKEIVKDVDLVQFMTVHPGDYGGEFVEGVVVKIKEFHVLYPSIPISVDGAMHLETAKKVILAGASIIILGGHIFSEGLDVGKAIEELKEIRENE